MFERLKRWLSGYDCKLALAEDWNLINSTSGGYICNHLQSRESDTYQYLHIPDDNTHKNKPFFKICFENIPKTERKKTGIAQRFHRGW